MNPSDQTIRAIRTALLIVLLLGIGGFSVDLILIGHLEDWKQLLPLICGGAVIVGLVILKIVRCRAAVWLVRGLAVAMAAIGVTGILLHFWANNEFQLDINPELSRWELFWKSVQATAPPALAPGVMIPLAIAAWAYTIGHPALSCRLTKTGELS